MASRSNTLSTSFKEEFINWLKNPTFQQNATGKHRRNIFEAIQHVRRLATQSERELSKCLEPKNPSDEEVATANKVKDEAELKESELKELTKFCKDILGRYFHRLSRAEQKIIATRLYIAANCPEIFLISLTPTSQIKRCSESDIPTGNRPL